jgi:hypothetical protein
MDKIEELEQELNNRALRIRELEDYIEKHLQPSKPDVCTACYGKK